MNERYVIELANGDRRVIEANRPEVRDGHLVLMRNYSDQPEYGWAPGQWAGFWPRPEQRQIDSLRVAADILERLIAEDKDSDKPEWEVELRALRLKEMRAELASMEAMEAKDNTP